MRKRLGVAAGVGVLLGGAAYAGWRWNEWRGRRAQVLEFVTEGEAMLAEEERKPEGDRDLLGRATLAFRKAIDLDGDFARARRGLARAHFRRQDFSKSLEEYEVAIAAGDAPFSWRREAGHAASRLFHLRRDSGDFSAAMRHYEAALAREPRDAETLFYAGALSWAANERERRDALWTRLLEAAPDSEWSAAARKTWGEEKSGDAPPR